MSKFQLFEDRRIGEGSCGQVYLCWWCGHSAAVKSSLSPEPASRFKRRLTLLESSGTKTFSSTMSSTDTRGIWCLITDYAERGSLRDVLDIEKLSGERQMDFAEDIISGMVYLHFNSIIHRDLKSPNILITKRYEAKIWDFGPATLKTASASKSKTLSQIGALLWMATEITKQPVKYSTASDIYALGMVSAR